MRCTKILLKTKWNRMKRNYCFLTVIFIESRLIITYLQKFFIHQ